MRVKLLVLWLLTLTMFACSGAESIEITPTLPAIPLEDPATATTIFPSPTLRPSATSTIAPTATVTATPTIPITITPESVTKLELTVGAANLRSGPGTEFAALAVIKSGADLGLLETNPDGTWFKVRSADGLVGWLGSSVVKLLESENH